MKLKLVCTAASAAVLALTTPSFAQTQSGSGIGSSGTSGSTSAQKGSASATGGPAGSAGGGASLPSTGTSSDAAGTVGSTSPRAPETSVGTSGATSPPMSTQSSGRCDSLTGAERDKCLQEQAATGTAPSSGSAGAGSTGMGR